MPHQVTLLKLESLRRLVENRRVQYRLADWQRKLILQDRFDAGEREYLDACRRYVEGQLDHPKESS